MRKKRILSVLCILLCLTFLPLGVFAQGTEEDTTETMDMTANMTDEELSAEVQKILETYGITASNDIEVIIESNTVYFKENGNKAEINNWISEKSKDQMIKTWSNQSNEVSIMKILKISEDVYKRIKALIPSEKEVNYSKLIYDELIKQQGTLSDIKSELSKISVQLSAGIKSILKNMDRNKMEARFDEASNGMKNLERDYFSNNKDLSQKNLDLVTMIEGGKYGDENDRIIIDTMLHQMYSNNITTSIFTKTTYEKGHEIGYFTALSDTGNCLTGEKYQSSQVSAFELFEGINGYFNTFNSSTFDARANENEQIKGFYEKNYVICMLAMAYDESTHNAILNAKGAAHAILDKAIKSGKYTGKDSELLQQKRTVLASECVNHHTHILEDQGKQNTLNKQFVRLVDEKGTTGSVKSQYNTAKEKLNQEIADAKVYNGHPGKIYCYLDDHWYTRTVQVANGEYPYSNTKWSDNWIPNFLWTEEVKDHEAVEQATNHIPLYTNLEKPDNQAYSFRDLTKNLVGEKGIQESMTIFKNFNKSFVQEIKNNFYYSSSSNLTDAKELKNARFSGNYPYFYLNGWQKPDVRYPKGCGWKIGGTSAIRRFVSYIDGSGNDISVKEMTIDEKIWEKARWDFGKRPNIEKQSRDRTTNFMWLKYASTNGNEKLYWTENADYGLDIVDALTNITSIVIDDSSALEQDQIIIHSLNEDNTLNDVIIKISVLQPLAVGTHTLTIANDTDSVSYDLEIIASDEQQLVNEGDFIVDKDSLQETLKKYEEKYLDQVVTLDLNVSYFEEDISEDDIKLIQEEAGNKTCVFADITLNVFADGVLKETASAAQIENPIKVSIFYPLNQTKNEQILCVHNGELSELTAEKNADGESVTLDKDHNLIIGEASKFSTYALVYEKSGPFAPATGLVKDNPALFVIIGTVLVTMIVGAGLFIYKKRNGHTT